MSLKTLDGGTTAQGELYMYRVAQKSKPLPND